jgi:hypothetical protein
VPRVFFALHVEKNLVFSFLRQITIPIRGTANKHYHCACGQDGSHIRDYPEGARQEASLKKIFPGRPRKAERSRIWQKMVIARLGTSDRRKDCENRGNDLAAIRRLRSLFCDSEPTSRDRDII